MSVQKYVSVEMLAEHAKKQTQTVRRALRNHGIELKRLPGVNGFRIPLSKAQEFLALYWPDVPPITLPQTKPQTITQAHENTQTPVLSGT